MLTKEKIKNKKAIQHQSLNSDDLYRDLFENANDLIQGVDENGKFLYVNKKWQEALGYSEEEARKMSFAEIVAPDHLNACMAIFSEMKKGKAFDKVEVAFISKDGKRIEVEGNMNAHIKDGKFLISRGIFRDITKRKEVEKKLAEERKELDRIAKMLVRRDFELLNTNEAMVLLDKAMVKEKEVNKAKSEFVSLASHQLKTPLSTISWYAEMLLNGDIGSINAKQKEYLDRIYKSDRRMIELVNALLNVSRVELGVLHIEPEEVDIKELAESALDEFSLQIKNKKLKIKKNYNRQSSKVFVDPKLMRIVLQNLFSNAVKYTPESGTITIGISVKNKSHLLINVFNTGKGIPKNQQSKIFTKLFRADNGKEIDPDGTGLGLYLTKSIIEKLGGGIWFSSKISRGTTFFVAIPLKGTVENY